LLGITDAHRVLPVVQHYRARRRLALQDRTDIELDFFRGETGAGRHRRIHLEGDRRPADRLVNAVRDIDNAFDLLDPVADLRRPLTQQGLIRREQFDLDRLRRAG
jgi:hypothetical protein